MNESERDLAKVVRSFAARVREERKRKELTQEGLSALAEIDASYIEELENGRRPNPTLEYMVRIAWALDVRIADLLSPSKLDPAPRAAEGGPRYNETGLLDRTFAMLRDLPREHLWLAHQSIFMVHAGREIALPKRMRRVDP